MDNGPAKAVNTAIEVQEGICSANARVLCNDIF